ncbi:MAG TPA: hypothetical protein PKO30_11525 [Prolixibacteraceae bacterium]|nr:hypothetical protein [Prolixibacteraceae bacterium]
MTQPTAKEKLRDSIKQLEIQQAREGEELKAQFKATYESLKLVNLVKSSLKEVTESVEIKNSLFESIISVVSGYVSRKLMVSKKSNPFAKIVALVVQMGVTKLVANNAEVIRMYVTELIEKFLHPKEEAPDAEV